MRLKQVDKAVRRAMARTFGTAWKTLTPAKRRAVIAASVATGAVTLPRGVATRYLKGLSERTTMTKKLTRLRRNAPGVEVKGKAAKLLNGVRVKDAGSRLSTKRFTVRKSDGNPLLWGSKAVERPSEYDNALIGVFFKAALRRLGVPGVSLTDWEKSILAESPDRDKWVGTTPSGNYYGDAAPAAVVKALLDDTGSGGLYLAPVQLDEALVVQPLLSGQLFPLVDLKPVGGRRVTTPTMANMTMTWGTASGTAVTPMSTSGLVSPLDTAIHPVAGFVELSNELVSDSPVAIGSTVVELFGERLKAELDRVIADGDGVTEPLGLTNTTGMTAVSTDHGIGGPPTVSDAEALIFAVPLQYRQRDLNPAFVGNDTTYRRFRGIPVGAADERRVFGMDEQSYQLLEYAFRVSNDLPNARAFFGCMKKYRMFQRLGMEVIQEAGGRTLTLSNTRLIGIRARFGGRVVDGQAFATVSDLQS